MTAVLTRDEMRAAMMRQGIPEARVEAAIAQAFSETATHAVAADPVFRPEPITFPIRLVFPWTALCSDNIHERASLAIVRGKPQPRKVMDARYKSALMKARKIARAVMNGAPVLSEPLALHARVYLPGGSARNDAINFSKCLHDAMEDVVYDNDRWLYRSLWERAGIDVDAPRCEVEIRLL